MCSRRKPDSVAVRADVQRFGLADPADVSGLETAIACGAIDPFRIVAVIGKTHGNGLVNDYTRGYLGLCLSLLIAGHTGETAEVVRGRIPFIFSGGVEGVLSPHYTVFTVQPDDTAGSDGKALAVGVAFTRPMRPTDIGRQAQIDVVAEAVTRATAEATILPQDVHFVQVKGPAFSLAEILQDRASGRSTASDDPGKLMAFGRAACALGVAKSLGEIAPEQANETAVLHDFSLYSHVASISAGVEVRSNEVVVMGMSPGWSGRLAIAHATMDDALDVSGIHAVVQRLGFPAAPQIADPTQLRAAFLKCEPQRDGLIRGRPHSMLNDGDIDAQRHIRAAAGAIAASILNDTALFVSGGAEHQGPDGGGLVAAIAERAA
jgi:cyanuric acid amidohydrolase